MVTAFLCKSMEKKFVHPMTARGENTGCLSVYIAGDDSKLRVQRLAVESTGAPKRAVPEHAIYFCLANAARMRYDISNRKQRSKPMDPVLEYEKKLYFPDKKTYFISRITHEDNYLIWKYVYYLRREEGAGNKLAQYYWRRRKNDLGAKLGIIIYAGCCAKGLHIWHYGSTIISGDAKVGENCTFHGQACIGNDGTGMEAPVIGNNVDIGVGAKIIGGITIADNVKIGAGAVVTRDCLEPGATLVGVPAKILKK